MQGYIVDKDEISIIANNCGVISGENPDSTILNISNLNEKYEKEDLVQIYNFMLLNSRTPEVMIYLIQCIDKYRDNTSLESLVDTLISKKSEDNSEKFSTVRIMCAKAIANLKNTDAVSSLLYCLNNKEENYKVRLACADALGKIGDKYAVAPLIDVAKDDNEKSVYLRETAVHALGVLGDIRAVDPLVKIIEEKNGIIDKFTYLKERAIEALIKMGFNNNERIFRALKSSLDDESKQVRINAIEALMDSEHPKAYATIKEVLENDCDEEVKKNAMIALYNMEGREILDEIVNSSKYSAFLKDEATQIIEEYENDEEFSDD